MQVSKVTNVDRSTSTARAGSAREYVFVRSDASCPRFICRIMNFAELAFWEGRRCASRYSCPGQAAEPEGERFVAARRVMQAAGRGTAKTRHNADLRPLRRSRETRWAARR